MRLTDEEKSELNQLLHDVCVLRDGGKCLRCGSEKRLCASHIYPKGKYKKMEYDIDNVKTLCYACHIPFWHRTPIEAHAWIRTVMPMERLERLALMTQYINKKPIDYSAIKLQLEQLKKGYENNK